MLRSLAPLLCAALFGAPALYAQSCVYSQTPDPSTVSGNSNIPLFPALDQGAGVVGRVQYRIPVFRFQTTPVLVRDLSFAARDGYAQFSFEHIRIRMGHTPSNPLSTNFQANYNGPATTVLDASRHDWMAMTPNSPAWIGLGLQQPFQYLPGQGDILLDIEITGATSSQGFPWYGFYHGGGDMVQLINGGLITRQWAPIVRLCSERATWETTGQGCAGSSGFTPTHGLTGTPRLGDGLTHWISSAPPRSLSFLLFGNDTTPPMPLDLGSMGMPGCLQYFPITNSATVFTNGMGLASFTTPVPNQPGLIGIVLYSQYVCLDPAANTFGATTSNYGRAMVGR